MDNTMINLKDIILPDGHLKTIGVKLDKNINNKLNNACESTGIKKGIIIRKLLAYSLPKMKIDTIALESLEGGESSNASLNFGEQFSFRITEEDYDVILNIKKETDMNINVIINLCLRFAFDKVVINRLTFN